MARRPSLPQRFTLPSLLLHAALLSLTASAERAPDAPPVITRKDWCVHGTPTRTTGECMCRWSNAAACVGPQGAKQCQYQYGLAWHHHTCEACRCAPKPWESAYNNLRGHMPAGRGAIMAAGPAAIAPEPASGTADRASEASELREQVRHQAEEIAELKRMVAQIPTRERRAR